MEKTKKQTDLWKVIGILLFSSFFFLPTASAHPRKKLKSSHADGLVIRNIEIEVRDVFDEPDLGFFYRTANNLKISTKESIIKRELILKTGERFDPFVLEESERNLRRLPFIRDVKITAKPEGQYVDILVSVQDTWTLFPQVSWSSGGGDNKSSLGIVDSNLLGYGKRAEFFYAKDEGLKNIQGVYEDDLFLGSRDRLLLGHFYRSDGYKSVISFGRPFRSLVEPSAWAVNAESFDLVEKLWANGDERYVFRQEHLDLDGGYTISRGTPDKQLRRYTVGYDFLQDTFSTADAQDFEDIDVDPNAVSRDPELLADDRKYSGPFFSFRQIEPDYLSMNYLDKFERIQDFNLGLEFFSKVAFAPELLGSSGNTGFLSYSLSKGYRFDSSSFVRLATAAETRILADYLQNSIFRAEAKYYNVLGERSFLGMALGRHTLAGNFVGLYSDNLDKDREFLLGAATGLRGYKNRTFTGDSLLILNLEDRFHLVEDVLKLVNIGGALFVDLGGTSRKGPGDVIKEQLYADLGCGLRFGFPRASGSTVWRIDLAYPLRDGPDGSKQGEPRLLFTIGQIFDGTLTTEAPDAKQAKVDIGF